MLYTSPVPLNTRFFGKKHSNPKVQSPVELGLIFQVPLTAWAGNASLNIQRIQFMGKQHSLTSTATLMARQPGVEFHQ